MKVAELSFTAADTLPATCQDERALAGSGINNVIHIVVTAHESRFLAEVKVTDAEHGLFDILDFFFR